jgi:DNA repair protein RecO (recombination protein O)
VALVMPSACLVSGLYVNELLVRLLHRHDPHAELFLQYGRTVDALADANCPVEQVLRVFEKRLLEAIGYGLTLDRAADSGKPVDPNQTYGYIPDYGPVESDSRGDGITLQGSTLLALAAEQLRTSQALREAKLLMRSVINVHLEGKAVISRELFPRRFSPARRSSA